MQRLKDNHEGARRMVISAIHRDSMQPLLLANLHGDGSCKASIRLRCVMRLRLRGAMREHLWSLVTATSL